MAVVKIYIGPDGSDANNGTTRALRIQGRTRLLALIDALGAGDTARIMAEGRFDRNTAGWNSGFNYWFDLDGTAHPKAEGFRLSATNVEDAAAPLPEWCIFDWLTSAWTDTGTTTTRGTKIWSHAVVASTSVKRLWAADSRANAKYFKGELWEGGANYTTDFTKIHPNLDWIPGLNVYGPCWTPYNAAGALAGGTVYMACPVDPYTLYPVISYLTSGTTAVFRVKNLSNWTVDPEITIRGGGAQAIMMDTVGSGGPCLMEAAVLAPTQYGRGYDVEGVSQNLVIGPYLDPQYPYECPTYYGLSTGHDVSGNHGIHFNAGCDMSAADGFWDTPGVTAFGARVKAASLRGNGTERVNVIRDCFHAGVSEIGATTGYHQYISIDDGLQLDFRNVLYGRAFAFINYQKTRFIRIGATISHNQSIPNQFLGTYLQWRGGRTHGKPSVGNDYFSPWGAESDKADIEVGFLTYSDGTANINFAHISVSHCEFMCASGGLAVQSFSSGTFAGPLQFTDNTIIRPWFQATPGYAQNMYQATYYVLATAGEAAKIELRNNTIVGYPSVSSRVVITTPPSSVSYSQDAALPAASNSGWSELAGFEQYQQAKRAGQIRT